MADADGCALVLVAEVVEGAGADDGGRHARWRAKGTLNGGGEAAGCSVIAPRYAAARREGSNDPRSTDSSLKFVMKSATQSPEDILTLSRERSDAGLLPNDRRGIEHSWSFSIQEFNGRGEVEASRASAFNEDG